MVFLFVPLVYDVALLFPFSFAFCLDRTLLFSLISLVMSLKGHLLKKRVSISTRRFKAFFWLKTVEQYHTLFLRGAEGVLNSESISIDKGGN
ncbi:MAG: hypothetical protein ACOC5F_01335 [Candidatus Aminicenantaceae bacterium]